MVQVLTVVAVLVLAVLVYAATRPDSFRIERSARIQAPPERVFGLIADFTAWTRWSPWEGIDPDLQRTYSGAARGTGAVYAWEGNNQVGSGRMEIVECVEPSLVRIQLDFLKPFEAHNTAELSLSPVAEGTEVTWAMYGPSPFMSKLMGVFMSMDRMVGGKFEQGLANLKAIAEPG